MKFYDSELKVMDLLWKKGELSAKQIADALNQSIGWNKNTTYTVIKKCVKKGWIERMEPGFVCRAAVSRNQAATNDTQEFVNRVFGGSIPLLFSTLLSGKKMSKDEIAHLKQLIDEME